MAKRAMISIRDKLHALHTAHQRTHGSIARLCLQVHDEIVVDTEANWVDLVAPLMRQAMEGALPEARVPFPVSLKSGRTLGQLQPFDCLDLEAALTDEEDEGFAPSGASTSTLTTLTMSPSPSTHSAFHTPNRRV